MKAIITAALLLTGSIAHADDGFFFEVGVSQAIVPFGCSDCWNDGGSPGAHFKLLYETDLTDRVAVTAFYGHDSNWFAGAPFNDKAESVHDYVGVGLRVKLGEL